MISPQENDLRINSNRNNDSNSDSNSLKGFEAIRSRSSKASWPLQKPSPPPYGENDFEFSNNKGFREKDYDWMKNRRNSKQDKIDQNDITIVVPKNSNTNRVAPPILTSTDSQSSFSSNNNRRENMINYCSIFWIHHPILKLVLVIICNGFVSMAFAAIFVEVSQHYVG